MKMLVVGITFLGCSHICLSFTLMFVTLDLQNTFLNLATQNNALTVTYLNHNTGAEIVIMTIFHILSDPELVTLELVLKALDGICSTAFYQHQQVP